MQAGISKHAEPIAECFAQFIAAFLPPKIMQADNGKEFKGALLLLLRKYGIQVINGAPRSPQTQGLVEQANGVVENKLRAWKMDHGSTEWKNGLLEVVLAMNTQIHSTIGCAPAELLFRERSSHIDWLNSQARKDLSIGIEQEDPAMGPIFESELQPEPEVLIDPRLRRAPELELGIEISGSGLSSEPELRIELSSSGLNSELRAGLRIRARAPARAQLRLELRTGLRARTRTRAGAELRARAHPGIELSRSELNSELSSGSELESEPERELKTGLRARARTRARAGLRIKLSRSELSSNPSSGSELNSEPERELNSELRRRSRARVLAQPRTELQATPIPDPIIERAIAATQRARVSMIRKYTKKHDIQHFDIGAIVSIKVPREDRTSTDNKRLFARILEEPYPHRYRVLTLSGIIQRLMPTKSLGLVEQALWADILIPTSTKQVTLRRAAREASTSARVGISCQLVGGWAGRTTNPKVGGSTGQLANWPVSWPTSLVGGWAGTVICTLFQIRHWIHSGGAPKTVKITWAKGDKFRVRLPIVADDVVRRAIDDVGVV
ncbi:hypothetical protein V500_01428 [Pseudogymnoascus sp. VKM F-4518 (FW-2643)]|nr:hypothetical protein V500_01428 [Pseudogymnoascus sp. VKM F-4518 (FW-2643)]